MKEALGCYQKALEIAPETPGLLGNLGNVLRDLGQFREAIAVHRKNAAAAADSADAHCNLALVLKETGDLDGALTALERAAALQPDHAAAQWNRALTLLSLGYYAEGWELYPWRHRLMGSSSWANPPYWQGEDLAGKHLLVRAEADAVSNILGRRFLAPLLTQAARVSLAAEAPFADLFRGIDGLTRDDGTADLQVHLLDLPARLNTQRHAIPGPPPYDVPEKACELVQRALDQNNNAPHIGILWSDGRSDPGAAWRSPPLALFERLAEECGCRFFSLQRGKAAADLKGKAGDGRILDLGSGLNDLNELLVALAALDLVITCDGAVAHLAASLGRPTWVLLNPAPHWCYLSEGEATPWYPAMRLFRQRNAGDWRPVFAEVGGALRSL